MKRTLLYASMLFFFLASWTGRYTPVQLDMSQPDTIQAEIRGEVASPGIYEVPWNASLETLVQEAGGYTDSADQAAVNPAAQVKDRQVVTIRSVTDSATGQVSLGSATLEELTTLPGIGPAIARRIIDYREAEGFTVLEDLMNVRGIGEKTFEKLSPYICL